ncbi:MAG: cobaltochelatase subunit CobN, partial [Dehalococcoidia bacterium]|nr:cobaltochelatase subunit CobN [Dehalococcoidia bacterium]
AVAGLDEPEGMNFVRENIAAEIGRGSDPERAAYRVFGSKPGSYGAGLLNLLDERNWTTDKDLADVYVAWGGYAYGRGAPGVPAFQAFRQRLSGVNVAVQNQDNREHDIFDSDDYFQFHGGMIASVRAMTGQNPKAYFGDTSKPERVKTRDLREEVVRVFRSRVVNPKWIESIQRHGYR